MREQNDIHQLQKIGSKYRGVAGQQYTILHGCVQIPTVILFGENVK